MKIRNRKSYLTSLPEGAPPANFRPRITQIIYYAILLAVVIYIVYIFGSRAFYYKEIGYIEVDKTIISASHAGKILKLPIKEGQHVKKNNLLATIAAAKNCSSILNTQHSKLKYELALNHSKMTLLKRVVADLKNRYNKSNLQRALETGQAKSTSNNKLQLDILKKQNEIDLLESQIILQQQQLNNTQPTRLANNSSAECFNENIYAPFNGTVYSIKHKLNEYTQRGEPLLMLISDQADVRVETYLKTDLLSILAVGKIANITLTEGVSTQAEIKAIHSSAYKAPERERNDYKPVDTHVLVYLQALNKQDAALWKKYDRMEIAVKGRK